MKVEIAVNQLLCYFILVSYQPKLPVVIAKDVARRIYLQDQPIALCRVATKTTTATKYAVALSMSIVFDSIFILMLTKVCLTRYKHLNCLFSEKKKVYNRY